jgi:hypothetical protein
MSTPRLLSSYPDKYAELFIRAATEEVIIKLSSKTEALRLRNRLYAFRQALYDEAESAPKAALLAPLVQLSIQGSQLVLSPSEPAAENIDEALSHDESNSEVSRRNRQHDGDDSEIMSGAIPE